MSHEAPPSKLSKKSIYSPTFCETLSLSAGRPRSLRPAPTRHHFMRGAQKNTVFGPVRVVERIMNTKAAGQPEAIKEEHEDKRS